MKDTIFFFALLLVFFNYGFSQNVSFENESIKKIIEITKEKNKQINYIEGFRIQIFSGNYKDCIKEEEKFRSLFPETRIFKKIENPFYKLWVGAYKDVFTANYEIKKYNSIFKSSMVIPDKIYYSEL